MKKFLYASMLFLIVGGYLLPALVFAQTTGESKCASLDNTLCWPQDQCSKQQGNWTQTADSQKACGPLADCYKNNYSNLPQAANIISSGLGYCYAKPATVDLAVPIGTLSKSATLTQYIPAIYNYLVAIVSIIAIVMIMVGGLRYLTAGGNPSAVSSAKDTILGAVIGLFLVFGSYLILQTINPALVQLKLPDIKMIRTAALSQQGGCGGQTGDTALGGKCKSDCDCKQGKCIPLEPGTMETVINAVGEFTAGALSLWTLGGGSVAQGAGKVWVFAKQAVSGLAKFAVKNPITTGVAGFTLYELDGGSGGQPGICIVEADHNVPPGAWCAKDTNCVSGSCVCMPGVSGFSTLQGSKCSGGGIGVCSGGGVGSPCQCQESGVCAGTGGCNDGLWCVDNSNGQYTKSCADGKPESPCYSDNDCKVAGYQCKSTAADTKRCMPTGSVTIDTPCTSDVTCNSAGSLWQCIKGFCSDGKTDGANCCTAGACASGTTRDCANNSTCSFYASADKQWIQMTGDGGTKLQGYSSHADWQSAYDETTGRLTQCKPTDQVKALP